MDDLVQISYEECLADRKLFVCRYLACFYLARFEKTSIVVEPTVRLWSLQVVQTGEARGQEHFPTFVAHIHPQVQGTVLTLNSIKNTHTFFRLVQGSPLEMSLKREVQLRDSVLDYVIRACRTPLLFPDMRYELSPNVPAFDLYELRPESGYFVLKCVRLREWAGTDSLQVIEECLEDPYLTEKQLFTVRSIQFGRSTIVNSTWLCRVYFDLKEEIQQETW